MGWIKLEVPTPLEAGEAEKRLKKGCKKAKRSSYIILIEQQVQHLRNFNDCGQNQFEGTKLDVPTSLKASLA